METLKRLIPEDVDLIFDGNGRPLCSRQALVNLIESRSSTESKKKK